MMLPRTSPRARRYTFLSVLLLGYVAYSLALDCLTFPPTRDETHFWPTSVAFSREFPPSLDTLRTYDELNTPLPFVVFGAIEHFGHGGIAAGRALNLILSFLIVCAVGFAAGPPGARAQLSAVGLLAFPYFLYTAAHLYTDIIAAFFVVLGVAFYMRGRHVPSAIAFILAISSRQYAVAFPAAVVAWEAVSTMRARAVMPGRAFWAALAACASLAGWYLFFGGFAPPVGAAARSLDTTRVFADHGLYFLSCVGAYFVLAEAVLFRRAFWRETGRAGLVLAVATAILLVVFPPLRNVDYPIAAMGLLDRVARSAFGDPLRMTFLGLLAACAAARFSRLDLGSLFVWVNVLLMMKAHIGWDKYALPLLTVLWYMKAAGALEASGEIAGNDEHGTARVYAHGSPDTIST